jgi:hypothetical protein
VKCSHYNPRVPSLVPSMFPVVSPFVYMSCPVSPVFSVCLPRARGVNQRFCKLIRPVSSLQTPFLVGTSGNSLGEVRHHPGQEGLRLQRVVDQVGPIGP